MKSVYNFVVKPKGERYNNTKKLDGGELILNTEIFNHQYVNREATVISTPTAEHTDIQPGDIVTLHHNVFRRWHDVKGRERNSSAFLEEGKYLVTSDQIYLHKRDGDWICPKGSCFVQPIKDNSQLSTETEKLLISITYIAKFSFWVNKAKNLSM